MIYLYSEKKLTEEQIYNLTLGQISNHHNLSLYIDTMMPIETKPVLSKLHFFSFVLINYFYNEE